MEHPLPGTKILNKYRISCQTSRLSGIQNLGNTGPTGRLSGTQNLNTYIIERNHITSLEEDRCMATSGNS